MIDDFKKAEMAEKILRGYKVVAVVGISDKPDRPSFRVASYLQRQGYTIVPVNPLITRVLGQTSYPDLRSIPFEIEIVDIFRKSEEVAPIVDAAIEKGAKAIWMQEGVIDEESAVKAKNKGLEVVMDLCMLQEHQKYAV